MSRRRGWLFAAALAGLLLLGEAAAADPSITSISEGRDGNNNPVLTLTGSGFKSVQSWELRDIDTQLSVYDGDSDTGIVKSGNTILALTIPKETSPGTYDLYLGYGKTNLEFMGPTRVTVTTGKLLPASVEAGALDPTLRQDLDDAEFLGGQDDDFYRDADNFNTGTVPPERFDAFEDLMDEGYVDGNAKWKTDHFSAAEDLADEGFLDEDGNLGTDWFSAWDDLIAEGKVGGDGLLSTAAFSAYDDLVDEGKIGSGATQVAAGNHDHDGLYLPKTGGTLTGSLAIDVVGTVLTPLLAISGSAPGESVVEVTNTSTTKGRGILVEFEGSSSDDPTEAVAIEGIHDAVTGGGIGIRGATNSDAGYGVYASTVSTSGNPIALQAVCDNAGTALHVLCKGAGRGILLDLNTGSGEDAGGTALEIDHRGSDGNFLRLQNGPNSTVARVDLDGKGYFNGGTATSGADFAESVKVRPGDRRPEPGDVMVIDPAAVRGFALCTVKCSPLVAGVVSTKPALLGSVHDVAGGRLPDDEVPLGITGIVPVKVSDENGVVRPGDLLVSASLPGHAMKAPEKPAPGTVLGKALGTLEKGTGTVEVLLTPW